MERFEEDYPVYGPSLSLRRPDVKLDFTNEMGNRIVLRLKRIFAATSLYACDHMHIEIVGPESRSTNDLTLDEAKRLHEALSTSLSSEAQGFSQDGPVRALSAQDELSLALARQRELEEALRKVLALHTHFRDATSGNQSDAYYTFVKGEDALWREIAALLSPKESST